MVTSTCCIFCIDNMEFLDYKENPREHLEYSCYWHTDFSFLRCCYKSLLFSLGKFFSTNSTSLFRFKFLKMNLFFIVETIRWCKVQEKSELIVDIKLIISSRETEVRRVVFCCYWLSYLNFLNVTLKASSIVETISYFLIFSLALMTLCNWCILLGFAELLLFYTIVFK